MNVLWPGFFLAIHLAWWQSAFGQSAFGQAPLVRFLHDPIGFLQAQWQAANWPLWVGAGVLLAAAFLLFKRLPALRRRKNNGPQFPGDDASFRAVFENTVIGAGLIDRHEKLLHANRALQHMLGYDLAELTAGPLSNFAHPEDAHRDKNPFDELKEGNRQRYCLERRFYRKDGRLLWLRQEIVARRFASDSERASELNTRASGAVGVVFFEDITRGKTAESELRITREAIHNLYEVIVDRQLDVLEKMGALLNMGCRRFNVETGVIGQMVEGGFEVLQVIAPDERIRRNKVYERSTQIADRYEAVTARHRRLHETVESAGGDFSHDWRNFPFYSVADVEVFLSAPINVLGRPFGVLCFSSLSPRDEDFTSADREFLQLMAQWLGGELERLQALAELEAKQQDLMAVNAQLEALATIDGLTGAKNRRAFDEQLEMEFRRARRYDTPLSLLLLDVDKFKQYNDSLGHQAGDEVLKIVAQTLMKNVRVIDFVARYGGEEFVVLLPSTDTAGAMILSERLRCKIADAPWPNRAVTASFGVATLTPEVEEGSELTKAADRALYASKAAGRNQSTHAQALPVSS